MLMEQPARYERPAKYRWTEHAERNAIYNAARHGISGRRNTVCDGRLPCADCAVRSFSAEQRGLRVRSGRFFRVGRWADETEISRIMFQEAGVAMMFITQQQRGELGK